MFPPGYLAIGMFAIGYFPANATPPPSPSNEILAITVVAGVDIVTTGGGVA